MRLLFAISVTSFCAVLWLALSLARRIRRDQRTARMPAVQAPAMEVFEAGEFRTPRELKLRQEVPQPGRRRNAEASTPPRPEAVMATPHLPRITSIREPRPSPPLLYPSSAGTCSDAVVIDSTLQFVLPERLRRPEAVAHDTPLRDISSERKSPQSARSGSFRRVDLSHYNQDLGDLTDPYTQSPRGPGIRPAAAKNG